MAGWLKLVAATCAFLFVTFQPGATAGEKGAGTQDRQWVEGAKVAPISPPIYDVTEQEEFVAARDGVRLQTRLFLPVFPYGSATPPCVLETDGYGTPLDPFFLPALRDLAKRPLQPLWQRRL